MRNELIYLIGQPGSGKSTLTKALFEGLPAEAVIKPIAHIKYPSAVQLGANRESFSGTDALPMNIQPKVIPFMKECDCCLFFGEGDRLANDKFFFSCATAGFKLHVFFLYVSAEVAAERREARGSNQNPTWLRGRLTKVNKLASKWASVDTKLDGNRKPADLVEYMKGFEVVRRMLAL